MPTVSRQQQKAMFAAAAGHSTLGIPKNVGKEFAAADIARAHNREGYSSGGLVDMGQAAAVRSMAFGPGPLPRSRPDFMRPKHG
jgi:hypothetical protein